MNTQTRISLYMGFALILVFVQSGCAGATQAVPAETVVVETSTPAATQTSTSTPLPSPTSTLTATPTITATFTPNVTATQLPEITPAVEGKGNVAGLVLWNNQPIPRAAVWLCEKFEGGCVGQYQYKTNTDQNGYYIFENVTPGKYLVAINSFSTGWFIFYFDSQGGREQQVTAGKNLILDPWSIWKFDLHTVLPKNKKDISNIHPTFQWENYPGASYYQFSIYDKDFNPVLENKRVDGTEFILEEVTLVTCSYYWYVEARNADGIKISEGGSNFINHSVPGNC